MIAPDGPEALRPHSLGMRGRTHKAAERERGGPTLPSLRPASMKLKGSRRLIFLLCTSLVFVGCIEKGDELDFQYASVYPGDSVAVYIDDSLLYSRIEQKGFILLPARRERRSLGSVSTRLAPYRVSIRYNTSDTVFYLVVGNRKTCFISFQNDVVDINYEYRDNLQHDDAISFE